MRDPLMLAPGVARLRPDDHFMTLSESDASRGRIVTLADGRHLAPIEQPDAVTRHMREGMLA